jgi:hypothetical protein
MVKTISIVVLHTEGCPSTPKTVDRIRDCTSEVGIPADLREVLVRTQEEADAWRFLGSPTVQVNALDIDSSARNQQHIRFHVKDLRGIGDALEGDDWRRAEGSNAERWLTSYPTSHI